MIVLGLLALIASGAVMAGVLVNSVNHGTTSLAVFNWSVTGTAGQMFFLSAAVGALAALGLMMILARGSMLASRRRATRHEMRELERDRKRLAKENRRLADRSDAAMTRDDTVGRGDAVTRGATVERRGWRRWFHREPTHA